MLKTIIPQKEINRAIKNIPLFAEKKTANFKLVKENVKIIRDDCLLALDKIESNSVDCIITDPPYFLDGMENN